MGGILSHLRNRILVEGPLSVAEYMSESLVNPEFGYYMKGDPLGKSGDFVTAPDISQMFGELIGLWCAVVWHQMGSPNKINLIELGPGRGTLLADAVRALSHVPNFLSAAEVHLVEVSPSLQKRQKRNLKSIGLDIYWHDNFSQVPKGPFILIANELIDVLPIHQFEKSYIGWRERKIGLDDNNELIWVLDRNVIPSNVKIPSFLRASQLGSIFELCQEGICLIRSITESIVQYGGMALIIDYGHTKSIIGDTFQAAKNHRFHDVLIEPGTADLTAHVDFQCLAENAIASGGMVYGAITQREFLITLGIEQRAKFLLESASIRQKSDILSGLNRLIDKKQMGELFKVLAICDPKLKRPEGFA